MSTVTGYPPRNDEPLTLNHPHHARTPKLWPYLVGAALVVALAAAGVAYVGGYLTTPTTAITPASGQALAKCRDAVKTQLKAPGTAKFGDMALTRDSASAGRVTGWVDAENGFGALVRNRFTCTAYMPVDAWWIQDVTFTDW